MPVGEAQKIALVGTSCTGKSTLLAHCERRFAGDPTVAFVPEAARIFFQEHPEITDRFSFETQQHVQALALSQEQAAHQTGARRIICDRSVVDAAVYVQAEGDTDGANKLLEAVRLWVLTYHTLLLLDPAGIPYQTDSIRQESHETRQRFHDTFVAFFDEHTIPYTLVSGTLEERTKTLDSLLDS